MAITSASINDTFTTIFVSPIDYESSAITAIYLCNKGVGEVKVNIHLVPDGEIPSDTNMIYYNLSIAPSDTYIMDTERIIFDVGDSVIAVATVTSDVVATISYMGI